MDLKAAKNAFYSLINSVHADEKHLFLSWCKTQCSTESSNAYLQLRTIAEDIRSIVPVSAIFPSECVDHSSLIKSEDSVNEPIVHVDSFLFEDEDIDALVEEGMLSRNYCKSCSSTNIAPITFISHSASAQRIEFIFRYLLPDLRHKVFLDVGSRLGAVLYGAYFCSSAKAILGVEINKDLCNVQMHIVEKYKLNDRIQIICEDIFNVPEVITSSNVIMLNNVFECFMPKEKQQEMWHWLKNTIKSGTLLITVPSLEETFSSLQSSPSISDWLQKINFENTEIPEELDDQDLLSEICLYTVL
ncbi:uncharacterized protein LOC129224426 [Uloborus diversus]|uniref:uncharacterized protein LOC129224426 n=1 Tax=Uloborus diversus TaxID=327109 RepID=UPI0024092CA1|nr:uncharacterized protein LOC129224426 [Uloborus diversus]